MAVHQPVFLQPATGDAAINYSAQEWRQYSRAGLAMASGADGTLGVTTAAGYQVTQRGAGANLSVDVAAGQAYVLGGDVTNQGTYFCWNDATVNVPGITVPGSGTFHHRIVLQVQDKLNNGTWTGYTGVIMALLDTGSGLPAEPASAITLATIDVPTGSASVTNSMINDFRQRAATVQVVKTAGTARTSTTLADDPDLQLLNLAANARYILNGEIFYDGTTGNINWAWRGTGITALVWRCLHLSNAGNLFGVTVNALSDNVTAQTNGNTTPQALGFRGQIQTGTAPCLLVAQWALNSSGGTDNVRAGSFLSASRLA